MGQAAIRKIHNIRRNSNRRRLNLWSSDERVSPTIETQLNNLLRDSERIPTPPLVTTRNIPIPTSLLKASDSLIKYTALSSLYGDRYKLTKKYPCPSIHSGILTNNSSTIGSMESLTPPATPPPSPMETRNKLQLNLKDIANSISPPLPPLPPPPPPLSCITNMQQAKHKLKLGPEFETELKEALLQMKRKTHQRKSSYTPELLPKPRINISSSRSVSSMLHITENDLRSSLKLTDSKSSLKKVTFLGTFHSPLKEDDGETEM
jgi:hypothetical protein